MLPGFVNVYKNKHGNVILYFYPGYSADDNKIYADVNINNNDKSLTYKEKIFDDGAHMYIFDNKLIKKIGIKLVENATGNEHIEIFKIK